MKLEHLLVGGAVAFVAWRVLQPEPSRLCAVASRVGVSADECALAEDVFRGVADESSRIGGSVAGAVAGLAQSLGVNFGGSICNTPVGRNARPGSRLHKHCTGGPGSGGGDPRAFPQRVDHRG